MDALDILNNDCWRLIFREANADDLVSCRQVCGAFYDILEENLFQPKWKFHLALPQLFNYFKDNNECLCNIRMTCSSWCGSLDKYLSKCCDPADFKDDELPLCTYIDGPENVSQFQQLFSHTNKNPFPSKNLIIQDSYTAIDDFDEMYAAQNEGLDINQILDWKMKIYDSKKLELVVQFGRHVSRLELYDLGQTPLHFCKIIHQLIPHVPNIIALYTTQHEDEHYLDTSGELSTYIKLFPLPDLHHLKTLKMKGLHEISEKYLLDSYSPRVTHLKRLKCHQILYKTYFHPFQNLKKLFFIWNYTDDNLALLRLLQSPLEDLMIEIRRPSQPDPALTRHCAIDQVLLNLKHLPLKNVEFKFAIRKLKISETGEIPIQDYANETIKSLTLKTNQRRNKIQISFNFLEALANLEELSIRTRSRIKHPENLREVVVINDYLYGSNEFPYRSNLWERVPSLKVFKLDRHLTGQARLKKTYSREKQELLKN